MRLSLRNVLGWGKLGFAAFSGIWFARLAGGRYTKHIAPSVLGKDKAPSDNRKLLNEVLRVVAMGAATVIVGEIGLRRSLKLGHYAAAFEIGGLGESARQGIGIAVHKASPKTDLNAWGLGAAAGRGRERGGLGAYDEMRVGPDGTIYGLKAGQWYQIGRQGLGDVQDRYALGEVQDRYGMGDVGDPDEEEAPADA